MTFNFGGGGGSGSGSGFNFGTSGGGFSFGKTTASSTPATTTAPSLFSSSGGGGGGMFSQKPATTATVGSGGGFSFGQTTSTQPPAAKGGFSFGGGGGSTAGGGFSLGGTPANTTAQTPTGSFSFSSTPGFGGQTTSASGGLFSAAMPTATTTQGFGFGGALGGSLSGGAKPFDASTVANTGGLQFGAKPITTVASGTASFKLGSDPNQPASQPQATTAPTGLSFGTAPVSSLRSTTQSASSQPLTGFSLGAKPSVAQTAVTNTPASSTPSFGFGTTTTSTPAPATGGFALSGKLASSPANLGATTTASGLKLGGFQLATTTTSTAATTTSGTLAVKGFRATPTASSATSSVTATASTSSTPSLRYCDLESKVNTWMSELEQQEKLFLTQATHVNAWGKLLIENADKITGLNSEFENVELNQKRLNEELDYIKTQQGELEELLKPLEENTKQQLATLSSSVHTHHADIERERTYNLAENIDSQLKNMVQDLREVVDHINSTSAPADANNPIVQIGKILSAHMDSLQWLDSNSVTLQHKVQEMSKQVDQMKKEQESKFRLAFN